MKIDYSLPVFSLAVLFLLISAKAPAQVSASERAALIEFYNATGGDSWDRNLRWLNAAGTECEWFGITCGGPAGDRYVLRIILQDNGLVGELPNALGQFTRLATLFLADNQLAGNLAPNLWGLTTRLDLSGNPLQGTLDFGSEPWPELRVLRVNGVGLSDTLGLHAQNLPDLIELDLSRNELEQWPIDEPAPAGLERINLGHNQIGQLPQSLADLPLLAFLDLNDNLLSGPIDQVLTALDFENFPQMRPFGALGLRLHVANNPFYGELPADLDYASFNSPLGGQSPEFGLDLCFTDIEQPDADTLEVINLFHRGGALESCLGRASVANDSTISGTWYNPNRSGEGITQMLLDNGQLLSYWFTYPSKFAGDDLDDQMWLFETSSTAAHSALPVNAITTSKPDGSTRHSSVDWPAPPATIRIPGSGFPACGSTRPAMAKDSWWKSSKTGAGWSTGSPTGPMIQAGKPG